MWEEDEASGREYGGEQHFVFDGAAVSGNQREVRHLQALIRVAEFDEFVCGCALGPVGLNGSIHLRQLAGVAGGEKHAEDPGIVEAEEHFGTARIAHGEELPEVVPDRFHGGVTLEKHVETVAEVGGKVVGVGVLRG